MAALRTVMSVLPPLVVVVVRGELHGEKTRKDTVAFIAWIKLSDTDGTDVASFVKMLAYVP